MDTHHPDELRDFERRLSGWRPAPEGLDPDAMLFAAGRASARAGAGRWAWPAAAAALAVLAAALGGWAAVERSERLALARQLETVTPAPAPEAAPADAAPAEEPPPDSYLAARRVLERGIDAWPPPVVARAGPPEPPPPEVPVLQVGRRDLWLTP
jgi:hypothetical protein